MLDPTTPELMDGVLRRKPAYAPSIVCDDVELIVCDDVELRAALASECVYVAGDPINLRDPWGLSVTEKGVVADCPADSTCTVSADGTVTTIRKNHPAVPPAPDDDETCDMSCRDLQMIVREFSDERLRPSEPTWRDRLADTGGDAWEEVKDTAGRAGRKIDEFFSTLAAGPAEKLADRGWAFRQGVNRQLRQETHSGDSAADRQDLNARTQATTKALIEQSTPFVLGAVGALPKLTKAMHASSEVIARGRSIDKIDTLIEKFGGKARDWAKKKTVDPASGLEVHWYEGPGGRREGMKWAGEDDPF